MADYYINPGEFKHKIVIQKYSNSVNADDIPTATEWVTLLSTKAQVVNTKGSEYIEGLKTSNSITKKFYIRDPKRIEIDTIHRISYKNKIYNIKYVNSIKDSGKYLEILAELKQ